MSSLSFKNALAIATIPAFIAVIANFGTSYWLHGSVKDIDKKIKEVNSRSDQLNLYTKLLPNLEFNVHDERASFVFNISNPTGEQYDELNNYFEKNRERILSSDNPEKEFDSMATELSISKLNIKKVAEFNYCVKNLGTTQQFVFLPELYVYQGQLLTDKLVKIETIETPAIRVLPPNKQSCNTFMVKYSDLPSGDFRYQARLKAQPPAKTLSFIYGSEENIDLLEEQFSFLYVVNGQI